MLKEIKNYQFIEKLKLLPWVDAIWLFGSRARGDNEDRADIDLAIVCPTASNQNWLQVKEIIENADTLLKIDCVRFDKVSLNNKLKTNIMNDKKVLYEKSGN
ncbi:MAG: nucleotidyltransferase domain-containing protein [Alphaproteobacteria bacterium]|nr:nucleotidyltransferase domain-containing protein [Alphaproteobacteria bacterium]